MEDSSEFFWGFDKFIVLKFEVFMSNIFMNLSLLPVAKSFIWDFEDVKDIDVIVSL